MTEDSRTSREPRSSPVKFAAGDSGTAKDVLDLRDEATFSPNNIRASYSSDGTAVATLEVYDAPAGTTVGNLDDMVYSEEVGPGDVVGVNDFQFEDVENDVVAVARNNDADVSIVVGGMLVTG